MKGVILGKKKKGKSKKARIGETENLKYGKGS